MFIDSLGKFLLFVKKYLIARVGRETSIPNDEPRHEFV